tara:strand:- start:761 stop:1120 length:360 start_codon:yes stop_codon:yes gene_type:complete
MKKILSVFLITSPLYAENIIDNQETFIVNKTCTSSSGLSIYDISLNTEINSYGEIRYRFSGQDVFYTAFVTRKEGNLLMGEAKFLESRTGDTRGRPWIFTYDIAKQMLRDNENIEAKCR